MPRDGTPANRVAGTTPPSTALDDENSAWVQGRNVDMNHLVTLERLRHEYPDLVREVHDIAAREGTKARLLRFLALQGESATCGYDDLTTVVDAARRTVRYHCEDLDERGIVERVSLGPSTAVEFETVEAYILTSHVLELYER